jgi:heme A synthase
MDRSRFARFAWGLVIYNLAVVVWGAYVRASVSGDGCGKHWPFCDGQIVPTVHRTATAIEYAHRVSSGLTLALILIMFVWSFFAYRKGHPARFGAALSLCFVFSEALLGASLVLFGLVAHNDSVTRAWTMSAHLINTFLLLASLVLTAWWAGGGGRLRLKSQGKVGVALGVGLLGVLLVGVSGSVAALVDTLYPAENLTKALHQDLFPGVHTLIRLRIWHPLIATSVAAYCVLMAGYVQRKRKSDETEMFARFVSILFVVQIALGLLNLFMLAPIWMQLLHLLLADLLWVTLILLTASVLAKRIFPIEDY